MAAANLSHRYITDRFLPDKAIDLMDEATSRAGDGTGKRPDARSTKCSAGCGSSNWPPGSWPKRPKSTPGRSSPRSKPEIETPEARKLASLREQWEAGKDRAGRRPEDAHSD